MRPPGRARWPYALQATRRNGAGQFVACCADENITSSINRQISEQHAPMDRRPGPFSKAENASKSGTTRTGLEHRPTTYPQKLAGMPQRTAWKRRRWRAMGRLRDTAAAPPDEPPAVRSKFQGLRVIPQTGLKVWLPAANSPTVSLRQQIAPLARNVAMVRSSADARCSAKIGELKQDVICPAIHL